jgi:integrating conjugative element protein (TIGR03761 family)
MTVNDSKAPLPLSPAQQDDRGQPPTDVPGALRSEVWLMLQTRHAQQVFTGRKASAEKPYIIGLTRFGAILSQLQVCVLADDPYADWWLLKVEEALEQAADEIKALRERVEEQLRQTPGMEVKIAETLQAVRVPLQFRNPYAYSAARILADFDTLVRGVLTARHIGLMDRREAERCMTLGARALRRAMGAALGYKYEGVKREDLREGNAKAQKARERMDDVPPEILDGRRRARHAPERRPIVKPPAGMAGLMRSGGLLDLPGRSE